MKLRIYTISVLLTLVHATSIFGNNIIRISEPNTCSLPAKATTGNNDMGLNGDFIWHGDQTAIIDSVIYDYSKIPEFTSSQNKPVWKLPVNFNVTSTGSASFSLPIDVPKAIGNVVPKLSISYSSQSSNGTVGYGCNITGYSVITRGPRDIYHDGKADAVDYSCKDAIYLDGQRMILKSGNSLTPGAIYVLENSPFTEITVKGNDMELYFTANLDDGSTAYYEQRQVITSNGSQKIVAWYLSKMTDANDNLVSYSYREDNHFMYLANVSYGSNIYKDELQPKYNMVSFHYASRPDAVPFITDGISGSMALRLQSINIYSCDSLFRKYTFNYAGSSPYCRLDNVFVDNDKDLATCVLETEWNTDCEVNAEEFPVSLGATGTSDVLRRIFLSTDLNGDGISDILEFVPSKVYLNSGNFTYKTYCYPSFSGTDSDGNIKYTHLPELVIDYETLARKGSFLAVNSGKNGANDIVIPELATYLSKEESNLLNFHVLKGGNEKIEDLYHNILPKISLFASTKELPLCASADIDNDGRSEIVVLEKTGKNSVYGLTVVPYPVKGEAVTPNIKCIILESSPHNLFFGDYNNDGLVDMLVISEKSYITFLNNGTNDITTWRKIYGGSVLKESDLIEAGDFNGDGIPDFISLRGNKLKLALGNGNGNFTECPSQSFSGISGMNTDNSQMMVYDFNNDGKSDVIITKAKGKLDSYWLESKGNSLSLKTKSALSKDITENSIFATVGDYNGDGNVELLNYGFNCYETTNSAANDSKLRIYPNSNAYTFKIVKITDALGNTTTINYKSLATGGIYERGTGTEFPVQDLCPPVNVVSSVTRSNGIAGTNTVEYKYGGLRAHCQGKGILGFASMKASNKILGTEEATDITSWDNNLYMPAQAVTTIKNGPVETKTVTNYTITDIGNKTVFVYPGKTVATDIYGNVTETENTYNISYGFLLSTKTSYDDGAYTATEYDSYLKKGNRWIPQQVTNRSKHPDDNTEYSDIVKLEYDEKGNTVRQISHYGTGKEITQVNEYDIYGNTVATYNEAPDISTVKHVKVFDDCGWNVLKTYTVPETTVMEYSYDAFGNVTKENDLTLGEFGVTTIHIYDNCGRNAVTISPEGIHSGTIIGWNADGTCGSTYFKINYGKSQPWTKTWYDSCGREVKSETVGVGDISTVTEKSYDAKGQLTGIKTTKGDLKTTVAYTYDYFGRILSERSSNGSAKQYSYGNRKTTVDNNGRIYTKEYDSWGNLKKSADPVAAVEYKYFSSGKPSSMTCAGSTVSMEYDEAGNRTVLDDPDAGRNTSVYDSEGKLLSKKDGRGVVHTYKYDDKGWLKSETGAESDILYNRNKYGNITSMFHDCNICFYEYDKYGRLTKEERLYNNDDADGTINKYEYDGNGKIKTRIYPGGLSVDNMYDTYGNLIAMKTGNETIWKLQETTGKQTVEGLLSGNLTLTRKYTDNGFLTSSSLKNKSKKELCGIDYTYDEARENMLSRTNLGKTKEERFTYDNLDRLTSVDLALLSHAEPVSDEEPEDNYATVQPGGTVTGSGMIEIIPTIKYNYSDNGNIIYSTKIGNYEYTGSQPHAVTGIENINGSISTAPQKILYNDVNKIEEINEIDKSGNELNLTYSYGPDNERWWAELTKDGNQRRVIIYGPSYEKVTEGNYNREFFYLGNGILYYKENGESGRPLYMYTDNLGSILQIREADGTAVYKASYSVWGIETVEKNTIGFMHGYTGHEMMREFDLINMNGRVYDPRLGRFLSPDNYVQLPESTQSFNRYSYCLNNPLKYTDPSGELFFSFVSGAIKGLIKGENIWESAINQVTNTFKIYTGMFVTDQNKNFIQRIGEIISRYTWQLPQTLLGTSFATTLSDLGLVNNVRHKYGVTVVNGATFIMGHLKALTLSNVIIGGKDLKADINNSQFQHEYGHYIQSQNFGPAFLSKIGVPSLISAATGKGNHKYQSFEKDANLRAFLYFNKYFYNEGFKWDFKNHPLYDKEEDNNKVDYNNKEEMTELKKSLFIKPSWFNYLLF